jgi:hypothetical protein
MHPETDLVVIVDAWESINPIPHTGIHNHMRKTHPQLCKLIDQLLAPKANKMYTVYNSSGDEPVSGFLNQYPKITDNILNSDHVERVWVMGFHLGRCIEGWVSTSMKKYSHIEFSIVLNCCMPHPADFDIPGPKRYLPDDEKFNYSVYSGNGIFTPILL